MTHLKNNIIWYLSIITMLFTATIQAQVTSTSDNQKRGINSFIPPVISGFTHYNKDYYDLCVAQGKPVQESPWGFQEINIENAVTHTVSSIQEYLDYYSNNTNNKVWSDGNTHIINFTSGEYIVPYLSTYWIMKVPARTIIQGAGIGNTIFKVNTEWNTENIKKLFSFEDSEDVVLRDISFHNETSQNKWRLIEVVDWSSPVRENFLFENIEFDDAFGAIGITDTEGCQYNFITLRGLRKRIGNTTTRIKNNYNTPVSSLYQYAATPGNNENIELAGQIGVRTGNSVVFHDCILGDNVSATIDTYNNYIEMVGIRFIDPLHDHAIKAPHANHIYIHDSSFELTYSEKIIDNSYYNPTFFTHEGGCITNHHFKNMTFTRAGLISNSGYTLPESEPFTLYNNREYNVSGDMVWENITFNGYTPEHSIVGYPNVKTAQGFQAINYTNFTAQVAQLKSAQTPDFSVVIAHRTGASIEDITGVYSWGQLRNGNIDYPRLNRCFEGTKAAMESQPYVTMQNATVRNFYNANLNHPNQPPVATNVSIEGTPDIGQTLTLNYNFSDPEGDAEGESIIVWSTPTKELQRSTSKTFVIPEGYCEGTIGAWIHPKDSKGNMPESAIAASNNMLKLTCKTTDIEENTNTTFDIYPNPVENTLTITHNRDELKNYTITNMLGQRVAIGILPKNAAIDIHHFRTGTYFIELSNDQKSITKKFIKL